MTIPRNDLFSRGRPFTPSGVIRNLRWRLPGPSFLDWSYQSPLSLNLITSCEEGRLALHYIQQQSLIRVWRTHTKGVLIAKLHADRVGVHFDAWPFSPKSDRNPLVRLNAQDNSIRFDLLIRGARKQGLWRAFQVHNYLS